MGFYSNDKIYVFLMNAFTTVQFASYRAYYKRLRTVISPLHNNILFFAGLSTLITGPVLALCDYHPWDPKEQVDPLVTSLHVNGTALFVIAQVVYLYGTC